MVDREIYNKVSMWFEAHKEEMIKDIIRLVRIESISQPGKDDTPFGKGCLRALEEMLQIGREHGFYAENYDNVVGSIGNKNKNWDNLVGFWNHLDVVPVGNGWEYDPFVPVVREHFLIGRGAQDNKGPAVGILYMMQCLRELHIPLQHELCLFVGTDEERGMEDMEYYTAHYPVPKLSMIADSGFPVCYGEKGIMEGRMVAKECVTAQVLKAYGGSAANMIPDRAGVLLADSKALREELGGLEKNGTEEKEIDWVIRPEGIEIIGYGASRHSAFPEGSVNAIHKLSAFLIKLASLSEADRTIFSGVEKLCREYYGEETQIAYEDTVSGKTTCAATVLTMEEGHLCLTLNIRYAITAKDDQADQALRAWGMANQMEWKLERNSKPNYFPKEHPAVERLTGIYNEITGRKEQSFVMGGGTYARKLPNAFAYGIGGMEQNDLDREAKERLFQAGHGGAHEPDEALNLRLLLEAMKIYTMAVIALNEIEL
ncbi:MAG: M20 family metallopeptidase [Lachnospiraceae bacterium]|nr:M20 family metallopeptidase [Lachnospiraceae bacterium]